MNFRIGQGYDVHPLVEGHKLIIGGVEVEHFKGAVGHSDADVLIHAICDALLGAAALGDIGFHFPPSDPQYKDISSLILLGKVADLLQKEGYEIGNVDTTVVLQQPKIAPYISEMKSNLANALKIAEGKVSIKATTTELLGFVGREEGVSAHAIALIY